MLVYEDALPSSSRFSKPRGLSGFIVIKTSTGRIIKCDSSLRELSTSLTLLLSLKGTVYISTIITSQIASACPQVSGLTMEMWGIDNKNSHLSYSAVRAQKLPGAIILFP